MHVVMDKVPAEREVPPSLIKTSHPQSLTTPPAGAPPETVPVAMDEAPAEVEAPPRRIEAPPIIDDGAHSNGAVHKQVFGCSIANVGRE